MNRAMVVLATLILAGNCFSAQNANAALIISGMLDQTDVSASNSFEPGAFGGEASNSTLPVPDLPVAVEAYNTGPQSGTSAPSNSGSLAQVLASLASDLGDLPDPPVVGCLSIPPELSVSNPIPLGLRRPPRTVG